MGSNGARRWSPSVVIVGGGFAGVGAAIHLRRAGFDDVTIVERAERVGGTWQHNTYPGLTCDVPSHVYSYSFAPNPEWTKRFSPREEIREYVERCAAEFGVLDKVRLGTDVETAAYDEARARWVLDTSKGRIEADMVVTACGALSRLNYPRLPGIASFEGKVFHSGEWDHSHDLTGRRVAVIGTGASAIQFVPAIQPVVEQMYVFQRSAPWIIPKVDREYGPFHHAVFRNVPGAQKAARFGMWFFFESAIPGLTGHPSGTAPMELLGRALLRAQVRDPELRRRLTPTAQLGCKRILISTEWYPALQEPNVEPVFDGIREVTAGEIVTDDGSEREVDTIIYGTGYRSHDFVAPMEVRGRGGETLAERWGDGAEAYYGMAVAGFPNLFLLYGPNTNLGAGSIIYQLESQMRHITRAARVLARTGARSIEVTPEAQAELNAELRARLEKCVWSSGCSNWYVDEHGRDTSNWPGLTVEYRRRTARLDPRAYRLGGAGEANGSAPAPRSESPAFAAGSG